MLFAFAHGHTGHVHPGSFADRHIFLTLFILAAGMSIPLILMLLFVKILRMSGIAKSADDVRREEAEKKEAQQKKED
jgi:hypothetical protein